MPSKKVFDFPVELIVVNMSPRGRKRAAVTKSVALVLAKSLDEIYELRASNMALQKQLANSLDDERRSRLGECGTLSTLTLAGAPQAHLGFGGFGVGWTLRATIAEPQVFFYVCLYCLASLLAVQLSNILSWWEVFFMLSTGDIAATLL